jgi:hypothetical protein
MPLGGATVVVEEYSWAKDGRRDSDRPPSTGKLECDATSIPARVVLTRPGDDFLTADSTVSLAP